VSHFLLSREIMKKKLNKSELIRGMIAKNPTARAGEIVALLKSDGVTVSKPLVYQAMRKNDSPKKTTAVKLGRKAATQALPSNANEIFESMQTFVNAAGSLDKAIEILSVFKK